MNKKKELQHARYVLSREFGERTVSLMHDTDIIKEMEINPQLRLFDKYIKFDGKRYRLTKGSPQRTKHGADYYSDNLKRHGFLTHISPAISHLKSRIPLTGGWLIYARDTQHGNVVNVHCTGCYHDTIALKSQTNKDGYVTKGMHLNCSQCGGSLKRYRPWW